MGTAMEVRRATSARASSAGTSRKCENTMLNSGNAPATSGGTVHVAQVSPASVTDWR